MIYVLKPRPRAWISLIIQYYSLHVAMIKFPDKINFGSQFKGTVCHGGEFTAVGTLGSWSHSDHIQETKSMNACSQFTFSFMCSLWIQPKEWFHPQWMYLFLSVTLINKILHRYVQMSDSQLIQDHISLTIEINYHINITEAPCLCLQTIYPEFSSGKT